MSLRAYPEYKNSGVEWLANIPAHWEILPLSRISADRCDGPFGSGIKSEHYTEEGALVVRLQNIRAGSFSVGEPVYLDQQYFDSSLLGHEVIEGDVLVAGLGDENNLLGRACVAPGGLGSALVKADCFRFRLHPEIASPRFVAMQLTAGAAFDAGVLASGTTRSRIPLSVMATRKVALPSLSEQIAIADFVDRETGKIDVLIAEQKKLLALLAEKRQATISHAVTRGLNPGAPMKESGVAWLGEVPAHWEVRRISSVSTKITNGFVGPTRDILVDSGVRYLQSLHIKGNRILFETPYYVREEWSLEHRKSILEAGDVLIVQTGDIGQVAVVTDEFAGCNCHALIIVSPLREVVEGPWIAQVLNSAYGFNSLLSIQTGALHPHLNCGNVKDLFITVPPQNEQSDVLSFIHHETSKLDALKAEAELAIELLKERRSALIAAAVTGKIDVRDTVSEELAA